MGDVRLSSGWDGGSREFSPNWAPSASRTPFSGCESIFLEEQATLSPNRSTLSPASKRTSGAQPQGLRHYCRSHRIGSPGQLCSRAAFHSQRNHRRRSPRFAPGPCFPRRSQLDADFFLRAESTWTASMVASTKESQLLISIPLLRPRRIARRGDLQDLADQRDPEGAAMLVDEIPQDFSRRRSPPGRKTRSPASGSRWPGAVPWPSRSRSFIRCASLGVTPSRTPWSTSSHLTHSFSVCGTQPIFGAIDSIAARTCSTSSWLNPLRVLSLHKIRGD